MTTLESLVDVAKAWLAQDPDPVTRAATQRLIANGDEDALHEHFGARLQFGTAGMRGALGPGSNRMNQVLVRRATAGLGAYVRSQTDNLVAVVGFDGRHGSRPFAADTASVLASTGFVVYLFDDVIPTPGLAHAVTVLKAATGVMVTASHNPPADNGYKVYWDNGAQIIPPHDKGISAAIDAVSTVEVPNLDELRVQGRVLPIPGWVASDYLERALALRVHKETGVRAVYTAMHGVGWEMLNTVLQAAGHTDIHPVPEQRDPDPDFPTVAFPNPEEPGALDLAMELARKVEADLIVANDPDADRLAVAVFDGQEWRQLTGNQIGVLLAEDLLVYGEQHPRRLVSTTIVSSSMLSHIATAHNAHYAEVLTGFKWIANKAIAHDGPFVIGYEEALGYSIGSLVRDKDGISAALVFLDLATWCKARGKTIFSHLIDLYRKYGYFENSQISSVFRGSAGAKKIAEMMDGFRQDPPTEIAGHAVHRIRDVQTGKWHDLTTGGTGVVDLPVSNVLAFDLDGGCRVLLRPSGTEPKIKFYFEAREAFNGDDSLAAVEIRAKAKVQTMIDDIRARAGI